MMWLLEGVVVTSTSQSQVFSSEDARQGNSINRSANFLIWSGFRPQIFIYLILSSRDMAVTCASACLPVPITPSTISFAADRYFAAIAPAAPVRISVSRVASVSYTHLRAHEPDSY